MFSVLLLGFLVGLQHATEADHLAAVASLSTTCRTLSDAAKQGAVWGLGHAVTLIAFGGAVLVADHLVPEKLVQVLEFTVGLVLIVLGGDVLRRLAVEKWHFHVHAHGNREHFHAHSHKGGGVHELDPHRHAHPRGFPVRALIVGMMHGMAGSAALIVVALGAVESFWQGLVYIVTFGFGSMVGMVALGAAISVPLRYSARGLTWAHNGLRALVGVFTIGLGIYIVYGMGYVPRFLS